MEDRLVVSLVLLVALFVSGLILWRTENNRNFVILTSGFCLVATIIISADMYGLLTEDVVAGSLIASMIVAGVVRAKSEHNFVILWITVFAASILMFIGIADKFGFLTDHLEVVCTLLLVGCGIKLTSALEMSEKH